MPRWTNWSGRHSARPDQLHFSRRVEDVQALAAACTESGRRLRVAGAGHSHAALVPNEDVILDLSGMAGVQWVDAEQGVARVWAGTPIHALARPLHDAGMALANQGDIDRQAIAGAVATGTHGNGISRRNLSAGVRAFDLVLADGSSIRVDRETRPELFDAGRLGLGAFGVVTALEISVIPAFTLRERGRVSTYEEVRPEISERVDSHRHYEFFWYPNTDRTVVKYSDDDGSEPVYPLGPEGDRCGFSYEVLSNDRKDLHTEMEMGVDRATSLDCLDEICAMISDRFPDVAWPVQYRSLGEDDVWLSEAYGRPTGTISIHEGITRDPTDLFAACEEIFRRYDARPHWGKIHNYDAGDLANVHPRWSDWWHARDRVDPSGTFLNDLLTTWHP